MRFLCTFNPDELIFILVRKSMILPFLEKLNFHDINKTHNLRGFGIKLASSIPLLKYLGWQGEFKETLLLI